MKKIIAFALTIIMACTMYARDPQRGYRGFFEWDNSFGSMPYFDHSMGKEEKDFQWILGWSTTHGYQINRHVFVGAGMSVGFGVPSLECTLPVFFDFRYDHSFDKFRPFGDLRIGYNLTDGGGIYFSPTIGHRFNWGRKLGLNLGIGLMLRGRASDVYRVDIVQNTNSAQPDFEIVNLGRKHYTDAFFTFRLGIDF